MPHPHSGVAEQTGIWPNGGTLINQQASQFRMSAGHRIMKRYHSPHRVVLLFPHQQARIRVQQLLHSFGIAKEAGRINVEHCPRLKEPFGKSRAAIALSNAVRFEKHYDLLPDTTRRVRIRPGFEEVLHQIWVVAASGFPKQGPIVTAALSQQQRRITPQVSSDGPKISTSRILQQLVHAKAPLCGRGFSSFPQSIMQIF
jgi:hypothetical protein